MKFRFFGVILLMTFSISVSAQSYYSTDSTIAHGAKTLDIGVENYRCCRVLEQNKNHDYTPYEVNEYKLSNGKVFFAVDIELQNSATRVFARRIASGEISIYHYKYKGEEQFFLSKNDNEVIPIPFLDDSGNTYIDILESQISPSHYLYDYIDYISYSKSSFTSFFKKYNNGGGTPMRKALSVGFSQKSNYGRGSSLLNNRYGFTSGVDFASLTHTIEPNIIHDIPFDYKPDGSVYLGVFYEIPLFQWGLFLHSELNFSRHVFSQNAVEVDREIDYLLNYYSVKLPVLLKYEFPGDKFRPYVTGGIELSHNAIQDELLLYSYQYDNTIFIEQEPNVGYISKNQFGISKGIGLEYLHSKQYSGYIELRHTNRALGSDFSGLSISLFKLALGINL